MFEPRGAGTRMGRGDVRAAVLALLAEQPMHGYQIIREIEERSGGTWKLSPGSVYPTLQLLADEGLISAEESNGGRSTRSPTQGRVEAEAAGGKPAPWESSGTREPRPRSTGEGRHGSRSGGRVGGPDGNLGAGEAGCGRARRGAS